MPRDILWYESLQTLVELASFLDDKGYFDRPSDVIDFFEKPWHYEEEMERYRCFIDTEIGRVHAH